MKCQTFALEKFSESAFLVFVVLPLLFVAVAMLAIYFHILFGVLHLFYFYLLLFVFISIKVAVAAVSSLLNFKKQLL